MSSDIPPAACQRCFVCFCALEYSLITRRKDSPSFCLPFYLCWAQVSPRTNASRADDTPPPDPVVTHVAVSNDGSSMATSEVARDELDAGTSTLRFWHKLPGVQGAGWVPDTVAHAPHKQGHPVGSLVYSPNQHAVVSTAPARSFKLWVRESDASDRQIKMSSLTVTQRDRMKRRADRARQLAKKAGLDPNRAARAAEKDELERVKQQRAADSIRWSCRSQCYWRDLPIGGASFSGDGAVLAVAYGPSVTLWAPMGGTLLGVLSPPPTVGVISPGGHGGQQGNVEGLLGQTSPAGAALQVWEEQRKQASARLRHVCLLPDSCFVVAATATQVQLWDVRSLEMLWCLDLGEQWEGSIGGSEQAGSTGGFVVSCVTPERAKDQFTGHAAPSRFAVVLSAAQPTVVACQARAAAASAGDSADGSASAATPCAGLVLLLSPSAPVPLATWRIPALVTPVTAPVVAGGDSSSPLRPDLDEILEDARRLASESQSHGKGKGKGTKSPARSKGKGK